MQPIDSNYPLYGVGNNAFLLEYLTHAPHKVAKPEAASQSTPVVEPTVPEINAEQMAQDPDYLNSTLNYVLDRARQYFASGMYDAAVSNYREYLSYQYRFASRTLGVTDQYFQALFEFAWLMNISEERKEAEKVMNEALLRNLDIVLKPRTDDTQELRLVRQFLTALQELDQLPSANNLRIPVSPDVLGKVVKKLVSQGFPELARDVVGHIEVRNLLSVFRAEELSQKLFTQAHPRTSPPPPLLPIVYTLRGLPFGPFNPLAHEEDKKVYSHEIETEILRTERIDHIFSVDKDPNQDDERERRQHHPPLKSSKDAKEKDNRPR